MLEHLHHVLAIVGAALGGLALLFAKRPQAAPDASGAPTATNPPPNTQIAPDGPQIGSDGLTARACMELVGHEAIVLEAYRDSQNIWTWGIGVTDRSGHNVERYIDRPQIVSYCLQIFIWLLRARYLPAVHQAFAGHPLSEAQLAAALSFHYNTGAILHASWVDHWKAGDIAGARLGFMQWDKPASIIERREKERDLFFDGTWSSDGKATIFPVLKPSYQPNFHAGYRVDVLPTLETLLGSPS